MFERLETIDARLREIEAELADPSTAGDGRRYAELARQHAELAPVVGAYRRLTRIEGDLAAAREMLAEASGEDCRQLEEEIGGLTSEHAEVTDLLRLALVPADPNDDRDVILEIRSAAGGDEAGLFAQELRDMYLRYADRLGLSSRVLAESSQGIGGVKESVLEIAGDGAFAHLKHESGVHRVQRVPVTESQGRIHTSTVSVAVLPAAEEVDLDIDPNDLRIDVFRSSGPGGQSVNTTDSAVRVTHLPSGVVVVCQDEKSQHQNREKALRVLRSRLLSAEEERRARERSEHRRGQIGTGDRAEKIRTYNFPQSRLTDHRIGFTTHALDDVLAGELDELVEALRSAERQALLADVEEIS